MDTAKLVHMYIVHVHVYTLCMYLLTSSLGMGVVTVQCSLWSGPYTTPAFCSLVRFIRGPCTLNSTLPCRGGGEEQLCIIMYTGNCPEIESGGFGQLASCSQVPITYVQNYCHFLFFYGN